MTKIVDARRAGLGDLVVGLWVLEGARFAGEAVGVMSGPYRPVAEAFGFAEAEEGEVLRVGGDSESYRLEMKSGPVGESRARRWQTVLGWGFEPRRPELKELPEEAVAWAREEAAKRRGEKGLALVFPCANYVSRTWPIDKWIRLAQHLQDEGWGTIALDQHRSRVEAMPLFYHGFPLTHVMALMREADVVVGNDSGMAHLAGALGVRAVAVMGPTDGETVFGHDDRVTPIAATRDEAPCVGCHFQYGNGYRALCDAHGCDALHTLPWMRVAKEVMGNE